MEDICLPTGTTINATTDSPEIRPGISITTDRDIVSTGEGLEIRLTLAGGKVGYLYGYNGDHGLDKRVQGKVLLKSGWADLQFRLTCTSDRTYTLEHPIREEKNRDIPV